MVAQKNEGKRQPSRADIQLAHRGRGQKAAHATSNDIVDNRGPGCSRGSVAPVRVRVLSLAWYYCIRGCDDQGSFCRTDVRRVGWVVAVDRFAREIDAF